MTKQNNRINQVFLMLLSVLMILSGTLITNAAVKDEEILKTCYINISSSNADIRISGIKAECNAYLKVEKSMSLKIKMELQKMKSGEYETIKTWTASNTGVHLSLSESRNINVLCDYRLKVTFTAGSETKVVYKK